MRAVAPTVDLLTFGRIAYGFQASTQRAVDASLQQLANSGFAVFGARASTHTALATLDGEVGDRHCSLRGSVGLRRSW
jgi:hypothetical protein